MSNPVGSCSDKGFQAAIPLQKGNVKEFEDLAKKTKENLKKRHLESYHIHPLKLVGFFLIFPRNVVEEANMKMTSVGNKIHPVYLMPSCKIRLQLGML